MNLLLFESQEIESKGVLALNGRRARHLLDVLRVKPGDSVRVGKLGGGQGTATVADVSRDEVRLDVPQLDELREDPAQATLIAALPRPQSLKKLLENAASLGVSEIVLINSARVEQAYFSSPVLREETIREHLLLGLEQARSTIVPAVRICPAFRPTHRGVNDQDTLQRIRSLAAHAALCGVAEGEAEDTLARLWKAQQRCANSACVFAVGPEGGWRDYEVAFWRETGFTPFSLGSRVLRVENAVTVLLGQLGLLRELEGRM